MRVSPIETDYFEWLCSYVCTEKKRFVYEELLISLFETEFTYILPNDDNRAADGVELRYRYGLEQGVADPVIASELDIRPCSVLEMLVALSLRVEESIMSDPKYGDQPSRWFWLMVNNLGLSGMTNERINDYYIHKAMDVFLNRKFESNGKGGIITLKHPRRDLRFVEFWEQIMWYLSENYI